MTVMAARDVEAQYYLSTLSTPGWMMFGLNHECLARFGVVARAGGRLVAFAASLIRSVTVERFSSINSADACTRIACRQRL